MTTLTPDLEMLRMELGRAFERDLARGAAQRRKRMFVVVAMATIVSAMSGLAFANDDVGDAIERTARSVMSVFTSDPDAKDVESVRPQVDQLNDLASEQPEALRPGVADTGDARRLLSWSGRGVSATIFATTTSQDEVCYLVRIERDGNGDRGGGECHDGFVEGWPLLSSEPSQVPGAPVAIYGIATDDVAGIRIRTSTGTEPVQLGRNAWFWTATSPSQRPLELLVELRDGSRLARPTTAGENP